MLFIATLMLAAFSIAGSAAYFSVYGLAYTFSGVFWSVVVMGASLEFGKLVAASYLYRYWDKTHWTLKAYLIAGVVCLMTLTSSGIFSYLSSGYQQDVLPLQQKNEQVKLLQDDRDQSAARKKQIDDIIAGGASAQPSTSGTINRNTVRAMQESRKAQESTVRQYKDEQKQLAAHISDLDNQLLTLKQDILKTEAHVGPIIYVAKAFGLATDDATKYLIFLIIFAFDPMAVVLTLCVNIALKLRQNEKLVAAVEPEVPAEPVVVTSQSTIHEPAAVDEWNDERIKEYAALGDYVGDADEEIHVEPVVIEPQIPDFEEVTGQEPAVEPEVVEVQPESTPAPPAPFTHDITPHVRRHRPYGGLITSQIPHDKISELIAHYQELKKRKEGADHFSADDQWEFEAIRQVLIDKGFASYL